MESFVNLVAAYVVWLALGFLFTGILILPFLAYTWVEEFWWKIRDRNG